jgi:intracellular septation protein A
MYEAKHERLLPRAAFYRRIAAHVAAALALIVVSLAIGIAGYMLTEQMSALDGFLNAAMLLSGMGEVTPLDTSAGKLFAGLFALYAGLVFVASAALVVTPLIHRVLHHFHVSEKS